MTDKELEKLAREDPAKLHQMVEVEIESQDDMSGEEYESSFMWVTKSERLLVDVGYLKPDEIGPNLMER